MHPQVQPFAGAVLALTLCACGAGSGLDGPQFAPLPSGEGPCFAFDITDGFADGAELQTVFDCVNRYGAFQELHGLVSWLTSSDRVPPVVEALNGLLTDFDVPAAVDTLVAVLLEDRRPIDGLLSIYSELYDDALLPPVFAVAHAAASHQDACERSAEPGLCSAPRLLRALLETDLLDRLGAVLEALKREPVPEGTPALLDTLADLLVSMSAAENPDRGNVLLGLGAFLLEVDVDGRSPLDALLAVLRPMIEDDALVDALVAELTRADREGTLDALGRDVEVLFTYDVHGVEVGFEGPSIVDSLLGVLSVLDPALLEEPFTLPGSDEPIVLLDLALDTLDDLYRQQADISEIVAELEDVTDLLCGSDASNELCDLVADLLPPITATIKQTEALPKLILPLVHVLHTHADLPAVLDLLEDVLAWDLLGRAEPMLRWAVENDLVDEIVRLARPLTQPRLGRLSPAGHDALYAVRLLLREHDVDGVPVTPLAALAPLGRALLSPASPDADLDFVLTTFAVRLADEGSALHADALADLFGQLSDALPAHGLDLVALVQDLLAEEPLWTSTLHVLAAEDLIALLRPDPRGGDATGWLRELITTGLVDRMLTWFAAIVHQLIDIGLLDAPTPPAPDVP
jgi:hypothetical protein